MRALVDNNVKARLLLGAALLFAGVFALFASIDFAASLLSEGPSLRHLEWAARLQPWNAEYRYRTGFYYSSVQQQQSAAPWLRSAVWLDPYRASYWFELFNTYQALDQTAAKNDALEHALQAEPTNPSVAWEAGILYVVQGKPDQALRQFSVVLANAPSLAPNAMNICWRIKPDADTFLHGLLPSTANAQMMFLEFLISKQETEAAAKTWERTEQLNEPIERKHVLSYVRYLLSKRQVDQAERVWKSSARLADLENYQPSAENRLVNGDFSLDVLNGGFDWTYFKLPDVSLALDPIQSHTGHRSLLISFDKAKIADAGIEQAVAVRPATQYEFSAYFKSEQMEGAGGARFQLLDASNGMALLNTDELRGSDFWKQVSGTFVTGPETRLLRLRIQRDPPGSPIQGKLWIDGLRLIEKQPGPLQ